MSDVLTLCLRLAGGGLILLALLHIPIGRHLKWREDVPRLSPLNADIFHVHTIFVCLVVFGMGLLCLVDPGALLERTRAGAWGAWGLTVFWATRLYCQWFVYRSVLWRGLRFETRIHWIFTGIWTALTALFALCGVRQSGWID